MTIKNQTEFTELCQKLGYDVAETKQRAIEKYNKQAFSDLTKEEIEPLLAILREELAIEQSGKVPDPGIGDMPDDFRVWDKQAKQMIYDINMVTKITWEPSVEPHRWHWMPCTGRTDEVGNKLYAFDIVKSVLKKLYLIQYSLKDLGWVGVDMDTNEVVQLSSFGKLWRVGSVYEEVEQ